MTFFQKVHFIQKCSVTQNTVFQYVKNNFLLSQKKLVFFTILNLDIFHPITLTFMAVSGLAEVRRRSCIRQHLSSVQGVLREGDTNYRRITSLTIYFLKESEYPALSSWLHFYHLHHLHRKMHRVSQKNIVLWKNSHNYLQTHPKCKR